ncbi:hypothetical protein HO133_002840 [Letharia lupina]|uniref:Uncharacterized protein n=1 Tax=Letharia lupina TaxID=560253 RepID=A0A8H6CBC8_9LECA|nr:uncharacterized protein HO133_002840 [Letharia lupina]KAF6220408.1 hypothetical protein HO133_002840 [Letharia lupina]
MSMRSTLSLLLLLCLAPLLPSAAPGAGSPDYAQNNAHPLPAATTANSSSPDCTDLSSSTGAMYPSCWDSLQMNQWMFNWNFTTKTCEQGEIWSTCFLRLAYGSAGFDCSTLGSLNCSAPRLGGPVTDAHVFYGAFNIYAINTYFTTWESALYALKSQPAIAQLAQILGADGLPPLTTSSLLAATVSNYGLDAAADQALVSILPSGRRATRLDTDVTYYSTQLAALLGQLLGALSGDFLNGEYLVLADHGQMMAYTGESLQRLEASLAGAVVESVTALENDP